MSRRRRRVAAALLALFTAAVPSGRALRAAEPARVAAVQGDWRGGPARDGRGDYCTQEVGYASGHGLMIGRTRSGDVNLALAIPGGALPVGERWPVTVTVDDAQRSHTAAAAAKGLLVVALGRDGDLFTRLKQGRRLTLTSAADSIGFELTGVGPALAELEKCVAALPPPAGGPATGQAAGQPSGEPPLPDAIATVLAAAGLGRAQTVLFPDTPPEKRPADHAWRLGRVLGGMRERLVPAGAKLEDLSGAFTQSLQGRCQGAGTVRHGPTESHPGVRLRVSTVDCAGRNGKGAVHVALVSYLSDTRLFAVYFHEAAPADRAAADRARDRLAEVFRKLAQLGAPSAAPPPAGAVVAPPPAAKPVQPKPAVKKPAAAKPATPQPKPAVKKPAAAKPAAAPPAPVPPP